MAGLFFVWILFGQGQSNFFLFHSAYLLRSALARTNILNALVTGDFLFLHLVFIWAVFLLATALYAFWGRLRSSHTRPR
jgi:hypothetical protein